MREQFIEKGFAPHNQELIIACNEIMENYKAQGYVLTLRQLYYQLVATQPLSYEVVNSENSYNRIGKVISQARLCGLMDWDGMEDRARRVEKLPAWDNPLEILESARDSYREDLWRLQPIHVEVWVEKDALSEVVDKACEEYRVPYLCCRGYMSQSEQYRAAKRFERVMNQGREVCVLHLGDHDPSGIDMTRDNDDRLHLMSWAERGGSDNPFLFRRIALSMEQIEEVKPPPNPTKVSDSRSDDYIEKFGRHCWELDALEPSYIEKLIKRHIYELVDDEAWAEAIDEENANLEVLQRIVEDHTP